MKLAMGLLASTIVLAGFGGAANAVTLRPAGKYAFTSTESCEAKFTFTFKSYLTSANPPRTDNAVRVINSVADGHIGASIGYITFTPKTATGGNVAMSMTQIHGGALRINNGGINVTTEQQTFNGKYTFDATSMTITPTGEPALAFMMTYGALSAAGAPGSVHLIRQDNSAETPNCVESIVATK